MATHYGCKAMCGHGLTKVSPGLAMPDPSMPCGQATLMAVSGFARPQGRWSATVFYPFWTPHAKRLCHPQGVEHGKCRHDHNYYTLIILLILESTRDDEYTERRKHRRKRPKTVQMNVDVDELMFETSKIADRHGMSSRARCDIMTSFVQIGGVSLSDVPCSQKAMIK
jgi:hypothetical protein